MSAAPLTSRMHALLSLAKTRHGIAAAVAEANGEHFNVFKILRVGHREVKTHSPMLAALLNPRGSHGQGDAFLRLFLQQFGIEAFDAGSAEVRMEHSMGTVTEDSGGRIDILIRDRNGAAIVIENKIYAGDQPNQMARNRNYDKKAELFYLTLDGRGPGGDTAVDGLRCISYGEHILAWLDACRKKAVSVPYVRETLSQYIHLIEELTNQNTSARMNDELTNAILESRDSYQAYAALCNAQNEVRKTILAGLNSSLRKLASDLNLNLDQPLHTDGRKYEGWFFSSHELASHNLRIGFQFDSKGYQNCFFGFNLIDSKKECPAGKDLQALFVAAFGRMPAADGYVVHNWWNEYPRWSDQTFESIRFGPFTSDLKVLTERLLAMFRQACSSSSISPTIQTL